MNPVTDAECHTIAEAVVAAMFRQKKLIHWTSVYCQLNRRVFRIPFRTTLSTNCQSKSVVVAVTKINGGTDEPAEVTSDRENPMVTNGKVDIIVIVATETEVKLKTIGTTQIVLIGKFGIITNSRTIFRSSDTAEAATDVLCVGSEGHAQNCDQDKQ